MHQTIVNEEMVRAIRVVSVEQGLIFTANQGLLAAKAAGMACAVVPCASTRQQDFSEADCRLRALPDLPGILSR